MISSPNTLHRQFPLCRLFWYLDRWVPLVWPQWFVHAVVENPRWGQHILLLRLLHFSILGLLQLCSFFSGAFLTPANLTKWIHQALPCYIWHHRHMWTEMIWSVYVEINRWDASVQCRYFYSEWNGAFMIVWVLRKECVKWGNTSFIIKVINPLHTHTPIL